MVAHSRVVLLLLVLGVSLASHVRAADDSCHPKTGECVDEPPAQDRPYAWIGVPPDNCNRKPDDCAHIFGLEYDVSHPRGEKGSKWCDSGDKIRCVSREAPGLETTPANELNVIAYNAFERDFYISHDGQRERSCRIPRWFAVNHPEVDAILFQEVFMGGCFHNQDTATMRELLKQHGFKYFTPPLLTPKKVQPGGMFIASRWPIVEQGQHAFNTFDWWSWDAFAAKGVSYAKIVKEVDGESRIYHLMSSHLQAGGHVRVRLGQTEEWGEYIRELNIPADEAVIIGGDLNTDLFTELNDLDHMLNNMGADFPMPIFGEYNYTTDSHYNDIRAEQNPNGDSFWIDFVLYSRDHLLPQVQQTQVLAADADEPFPICWCDECVPFHGFRYADDAKCKNPIHVHSLSDHQPVLGHFVF